MAIYQVVRVEKVCRIENASYSSNWIIEKMKDSDVFIEVGDSPKELCKVLKEKGFINSADMRKIGVSDMSRDIIDVRVKKSLEPLCRLQIAKWKK